MKMVKSLLLGSAAALMAVAGAQAADLPVKAKPVEYVKVCSLYGAGFYYMPGTDICIKIGGYVRAQYYSYNNATQGAFYGNTGFTGREVGASNNLTFRARAVMTIDTRQQTEYGTLRSYLLFGFSHDGPGNANAQAGGTTASVYANRAFIQLAGFTFGKAQSFYDIYSNASMSYFGLPSPDTGDGGVNLAAYTAQFGNGFTGTISIEDPRRAPIVDTSWANGLVVAGALGNNADNVRWPDVVGVLRVDQAWGSAQIAGVLHDASAGYYGTSLANAVNLGHPDDKMGWAISGGAILNADAISAGDKFQFQISYTEGALRYLDITASGANGPFQFSGGSLGLGYFADGIYNGASASSATASGVSLTKAFGVNAGYDHRWNQQWKTSLYGGYLDVRFSDDAVRTADVSPCKTGAITLGVSSVSNCSPNWSQWYIGSRTQFNINSSTYLGLDLMYRKLNTAFAGTAVYTGSATTIRPTGAYTIEDQDAFVATFRVHRDFLP